MDSAREKKANYLSGLSNNNVFYKEKFVHYLNLTENCIFNTNRKMGNSNMVVLLKE